MENNFKSKKIAYMLPMFPNTSETFILREINGIGDKIVVYALKRPTMPYLHYENFANDIASKCVYAFPDNLWRHLLINVISLMLHPIRYCSTLKIFASQMFKTEPINAVRVIYHFFCGIGFSSRLRKQRIEHIHSHFTTGTNMALAASKFLQIPFSFTAHASGDIFVKPTLLEEKVKNSHFVIAVCEYSKKYLDSFTNYKYSEKLRLIYNGVDPNEAHKCTKDKPVRDIVSKYQPNTIKLISVGRLVNCKGFYTLIEACRILKKRGHDFRCDIIGDGPDRDIISEQIQRWRLEQTILVSGYASLSSVYDYLSEADIFVLLSEIHVNGYRDGFPTVILEAMLMSLPVVSTWVSGIPEMVINGKTGLLIHERDSIAAADALETLINAKTLRQAYGVEGRKRVLEQFNLKNNLVQVRHLFSNEEHDVVTQ